MTASIFFADGFDDYNTLSQKWDASNTGGSFAISTATVRTGPQALFQNNANGNGRLLQLYSARATVIAGFAIYISNTPASEQQLCSYWDSAAGANQVELTLDGSGTLRARRGGSIGTLGTLLGTASSSLAFFGWHYLEFQVTVNGSSGVVKVWLDGNLILNLSSQNTQSTANAFSGAFRFAAELPGWYADDFYLLDPTVGGAYSTALGDVKMVTSLPSGNGTQNDYTRTFASWPASTAVPVGKTILDSNGNVQRVQSIVGAGLTASSHPTWATTGGATTTDNPGTAQVVWVCLGSGSNPGAQNCMAVSEAPPDDDSSYVTDATVGHLDRYTYPSISGSAVKAVCVNMRAEKDDAGTRQIRACGKSGGTTFDNGADFSLSLSSYGDFFACFEVDPNTGVAWTVSGVNAAEFGVKTTA